MKTLHSPFKFLDAYTLADRTEFFGRDKEIEKLYQLIFKTPLLLVYGASGTGKTSLIQCGLASRFDGTDWLPLWIRREENVNQALENAIHEALPDGFEKDKTISENITQLYQHYLRPVFLIFDQFEELFVFGEAAENEKFIKNITTILDKELPCNIIMVIREEYLGHLYPFEKEIPELFDFRMRVEPMDTARVKEVLTSSFTKFNIEVEPSKEERLDQIIENVSRGKSGIELPYLQVYLDRLYREDFVKTYPDKTLTKSSDGNWYPIEFTKTEIEKFGTIEMVLDKFLDEQIQKIQANLFSKDRKVKPDAVRLLLDAFVSDEGTKRPIRYQRVDNQIQLMATEENMPRLSPGHLDFCINALEEARLLRSDANTLELAHDSLAAIIDKRRTNEQRQLNDIRRQIRSMHQNFPKTKEYLTSKQITVFEDYIPLLYLNFNLRQFFQDSQKFRGKEATEELEKVRQQAEQERKLKEQAEAQKSVAEKNEKRARGRTWMAGIFGLMAAGVALLAFSLYGRANELTKATEKQKIEIEKNLIALKNNEIALQSALKTAQLAKDTAELKRIEAELANEDARRQTSIAVSAKANADVRRQEAEAAKYTADREKEKTKQALGEVQKAKIVTEEALGKANTLVDAFYFYADRFALAFKDRKFYFIDKDGKEVKKLGKWTKAEQFDYRGFATIHKNDTPFLLDTFGNTYKLAYSLETLEANSEALNLSNQKLKQVPAIVWDNPQLKVLILSENHLENLPKQIGQLSNLISLYLEENNLYKLPAEIGQLSNLSTFSLSYNKLDELPMEVGQLSKLTVLSLSDNKLAELPMEIGQLNKLTVLSLSENKLAKLPTGIGQLSKLTVLSLGDNDFTVFPKEIGQLKNLSLLIFRDNKLVELPGEIGQLSSLFSLDLSRNKLAKIPKEIGQLNSLSSLDLSSNNIVELPGEIGQLSSLSSLDLRYNKLTKIPGEIGQLSSLFSLYLSSNYIIELPKEMGRLSNLSSLNIKYNKLTKLPIEIGQLNNLSWLGLSSNNIVELPKEIGRLSNLASLDVRDNPIEKKIIEVIKSWLPNRNIYYNFVYQLEPAQNAYRRKKYDEAFKDQQQSVEEDQSSYSSWYNLSFYALFAHQPKVAIEAALKVKELNSKAIKVDTNLALGYLMNSQWSEAQKIYQQYKGKHFPNDKRLCDEVFLKDIADLEAAGITHPDFEKVKQLFKK